MNGRIFRVRATEPAPEPTKDSLVSPLAVNFSGDPGKQAFRDLLVPNGTWMMSAPFSRGYSWLIGANQDELRFEPTDRPSHQQEELRLADKPFGYVYATEAYCPPGTDKLVPQGQRHLIYAMQIDEGEVRNNLRIPKLESVRESRGSRRRQTTRWVRLNDATAACGISAYDLMNIYWPFVGSSRSLSGERPGQLHVRYSDGDADMNKNSPQDFFVLEELNEWIDRDEMCVGVWIHAALANTILRLRALGYQPTAT